MWDTVPWTLPTRTGDTFQFYCRCVPTNVSIVQFLCRCVPTSVSVVQFLCSFIPTNVRPFKFYCRCVPTNVSIVQFLCRCVPTNVRAFQFLCSCVPTKVSVVQFYCRFIFLNVSALFFQKRFIFAIAYPFSQTVSFVLAVSGLARRSWKRPQYKTYAAIFFKSEWYTTSFYEVWETPNGVWERRVCKCAGLMAKKELDCFKNLIPFLILWPQSLCQLTDGVYNKSYCRYCLITPQIW